MNSPVNPEILQITRAYSPAGLGKAYFQTMGIPPFLERQPDISLEVLGLWMTGYFGGRSEAHVRRQIVPVTLLDVRSMYPTACVLMHLWEWVVAQRLDVREATRDVRAFLEAVRLDDLFHQDTWPKLRALVCIEPRHDILPVRAPFLEGGDLQIGLEEIVRSDAPLWYPLADVVASKLLTGSAPKVLRAIRLRPVGRLPRLRPTRLRGDVAVNPAREDFFRKIIEERARIQRLLEQAKAAGNETGAYQLDALQHFLKILANATSYGIFAEFTVRRTGAREALVYGLRTFKSPITTEEHPGRYAFPPLAALVTSGARLILAMIECLLRETGATYLFCDTDSMAVVADHTVVESIQTRFQALNPYAFGGDLLRLEEANTPDPRATRDPQLYGLAISAKRYVLFNQGDNGEIIIRRKSEHGLGHLLSPMGENGKAWIDAFWGRIIRFVRGEARNFRKGSPFPDAWALGKLPIMKPSTLRQFQKVNSQFDRKRRTWRSRPYAQQVKPFNFMLVAYPDTGDITTGGEAFAEEIWNDETQV